MRTIVSVQALRAFAAISVAVHHFDWLTLALAGHKDDPEPFYQLSAGVDIFFVISGFIMVYSSRELFRAEGAYRLFLIKRFCRIIPIYWLVTLIALYVMQLPFGPESLLKSLFFVPFMQPNGNIAPLLGVGWSLNFEMLFYCLFASALWLGRGAAVLYVSALLLAITSLGALLSPPQVILSFWSDPIIIEFVFGMVLGLLYERSIVISSSLRLVAMIVALGAFWFSAQSMPPSHMRFLYWGLPAAVLVGACVLGEHEPETGPFARFASLIGDASYAIYLIHPLVGSIILVLWPLGLNQYSMTAVAALGLLCSVGIATAFYWFVERRMTRSLQRFFIGRLAKAPVAALALP